FTNGAAPMSNPVAYWNKVATDTINTPSATPATAEETRFFLQADLATVHVAIYDAVNAITGTHRTFAATPTTSASGASQDAAAGAAAYGVLKALFPSRSAQYQAAYDTFVATIAAGDAKTRGLAIGAEVANGVVALRAGDGRMTVVSYTPGTAAGKFRGVNPVGNYNRYVKPFVLTSASQFRAADPPALDSAAYATDFNEVRTLGGTVSTARTAAQLETGRFHAEGPTTFPPRNYRSFAMDSRSLADNARLMAMVWVSIADASIACFESKYFFDFWRPLSAIPLADTDGNPGTTLDAAWTPVVPTPNYPGYPSVVPCTNSAAMAAVKAFFGTNEVKFSLNSTLTGTQREYDSPNAYLDETGQRADLRRHELQVRSRAGQRARQRGRQLGCYEQVSAKVSVAKL
ncbi:MAG: vanadium-dependent haloperoxidase, partial [Burkholderiaceae bacterium]